MDDFTHHGPNSTTHVSAAGFDYAVRCDDCAWGGVVPWSRSVAVEAAVVHTCKPHPEVQPNKEKT